MIESSATGFKPNSPVKACILPSVYIGGFMTDASGAYSGVLPVPAGVSTGQQTLQANGFTSSGALRSLSLGILVRPAAPVTMRTAEAEVLFDTLSAQITPQGRAILISLVRKTRTQGMSTVVIGYVQPGARARTTPIYRQCGPRASRSTSAAGDSPAPTRSAAKGWAAPMHVAAGRRSPSSTHRAARSNQLVRRQVAEAGKTRIGRMTS